MPKVKLRAGAGKHRLNDGTVCKAGQTIEVTESQLACFGDKFERVLSADELKALAAKQEAEEKEAKAQAEKAKAGSGQGKG